MLLARAGMRVLVIDRVSFPRDTLSTHQVQVPAVARLARWGLLDRVLATNAPPTRHLRFQQGDIVLEGSFPTHQGADAVCSPRRTVLDAILVDAAREAGAEVREDVFVDDLILEDGRVVGVRGHRRDGPEFAERARVVIGADGKHSLVAKVVGATVYRERPAITAAFYAYWDGVPMTGGEIYGLPGRAVGVWPTNDGLVITFVSSPARELARIRGDIEGSLMAAFDAVGDLGDRIRAGRRVERIRGTIDVPNTVRTPFGAGWALVGDAGLVMDPISGQGISHAFQDAELLSDAVVAGLGGTRPLDDALGDYHRARDHAALPMFDFTYDLAKLEPLPVEARVLFSSMIGRQDQIDRFFGVFTGSEPLRDYMSSSNMRRIVGVRGLARIVLGKIRGDRSREAA
jgi:2-polyprenyl-6-methoxyphenol hydroxylase-like FAD-dependent oxidoreductase